MANERLRALLLERGETLDKLAEAVHVDAKTVERWITKGRTPYRSHRYAVATFLGVDESYIWPDALGRDEVAAVSESEIVAVYPHRWALPRDTLGRFFSEAEREIGALVYAGHVGTGFSDPVLRMLTSRLDALRRPDSPFDGPVPAEYARPAVWVEPRLVIEVTFDRWTRAGRMRAPAYRGLRDDKDPADVVRET